MSHPSHLDLMYTNRHFLVKVDPTGLAPGAHQASIMALDASSPDRGKLWEVAYHGYQVGLSLVYRFRL